MWSNTVGSLPAHGASSRQPNSSALISICFIYSCKNATNLNMLKYSFQKKSTWWPSPSARPLVCTELWGCACIFLVRCAVAVSVTSYTRGFPPACDGIMHGLLCSRPFMCVLTCPPFTGCTGSATVSVQLSLCTFISVSYIEVTASRLKRFGESAHQVELWHQGAI